ncbi:hypothetical protein ACVIKO_002315 [Rhizobium ruizarguesonis]
MRDLVFAAQILRPEFAGLLGEVEEDRAGFEDAQRTAAIGRLVIDDGRHAVIGVESEIIRLELVAPADIDRHQPIGRTRFLQEDRNFLAVRRRPVVEINHLRILVCSGFPGKQDDATTMAGRICLFQNPWRN